MRPLACLVAFLLLAADEPPKKKIPVTGDADERFARFDELMTVFLQETGYPGAALAISKDGKVVYSRGFGYAERETKQEVKPESLFRVSSVSKPITAAAVLHLVDAGKLDLDEKVMEVLDLKPPTRRFDDRWKKVTIRHLLEHRGGWDLTKSDDPMFISPTIVREVGGLPPAMPATIIRYMLSQPLDFDPGTKHAYSNFGYCLLGRVIEKLGKQSYESYVRKHVLTPLGIKTMRLGKSLYLHRAKNEVKYYAKLQLTAVLGPGIGRPCPAAYGGFCVEAMDAHAGWIASAEDALKFTIAFEDPSKCKILKPATVERMMARPEGVDPKAAKWYGLGWNVQPIDKKPVYFHDGALEGTAAMVVSRPDGVGIAVLLNCREKLKDDQEPIGVLNGPLHQLATQAFAKP